MALNACLLIKTTPLETEKVKQRLKRMKDVRKVFVAYGRYDLVAFAQGSTYASLRKLTGLVNAIDGVRSTETLVEA